MVCKVPVDEELTINSINDDDDDDEDEDDEDDAMSRALLEAILPCLPVRCCTTRRSTGRKTTAARGQQCS